jgi:hypothetical protein
MAKVLATVTEEEAKILHEIGCKRDAIKEIIAALVDAQAEILKKGAKAWDDMSAKYGFDRYANVRLNNMTREIEERE